MAKPRTIKRLQSPGLPFTLVELMCVMAILFLLMSMMLPNLSRVRRLGYRGNCIYNLHSVELALATYEFDYGTYPHVDPVIGHLAAENYIDRLRSFRCPADRSADGDTYSVGYLGGHPAAMAVDDPLAVCGWHTEFGPLAAFTDHSVGPLNERTGSVSVPVTISAGNEEVGPGFTFLTGEALTVTSPDGNEATVYGKNGAYFISASYDPYGNYGNGSFTVMLGFDADEDHRQEVKAEGTAAVEFITRLEYVTVRAVSDPDGGSAKVVYDRQQEFDMLQIFGYSEYRVTHRLVGEEASDTYTHGAGGAPNAFFKVTADSLGQAH